VIQTYTVAVKQWRAYKTKSKLKHTQHADFCLFINM